MDLIDVRPLRRALGAEIGGDQVPPNGKLRSIRTIASELATFGHITTL